MMQRSCTLRRAAVPALLAALLFVLAGCGPSVDQMREREASASAAASAAAQRRASLPPASPTPAPPAAGMPDAAPEGAPALPPAPSPAPVGVTGSQAGMPQPVQDACQVLLRREDGPLPAGETAACVSAAMVAGEGGMQALATDTSWLPNGTYTVRFTTGPSFSLFLDSPEQDLFLSVGADGAALRTRGTVTEADPEGSAEEASAAVLVSAAALTTDPARVEALLGTASAVSVEYDVPADGGVRTVLRADVGEDGGGAGAEPARIAAGTLTLVLDDYYRPLRIEIRAITQGIPSTITAVNTDWGAAVVPRSVRDGD